MNRRIAAALQRLVAIALLACAGAGIAMAERKTPQLEPGDGFVIARVTGKLMDRAWFEQVDGKNTFYVGRNDGPVLLRVKAGRYYLKKAKSKNSNVDIIGFPAPSDGRQTLDIKEGVVNCIGDWVLDWELRNKRPELAMDWLMNDATVDDIRERNDIDALSFYVVRVGQAPVKVDTTVALK